MPKSNVSRTVLLDGAQMSLAAIIAGAAGFLKKHNIPSRELVDYIGDKFEDSLGELEGRGADEVMQHLLELEILPLGVEVVSSETSADRAVVTLTTLPPTALLEKFGTTPEELLEGFDITQRDFEAIFRMYAPMTRAIGLKFNHTLRDGREIISLEKAPQ